MLIVSREDVRRFMEQCMVSVGTNKEHAAVLAKTLEMADYRGHYSHGLNRLHMYVNDVSTGITCSGTDDRGDPLEPKVLNARDMAVASVDGHNLLGPVVGRFCMDLAISKASKYGIGMVVARGSNHFGIAGAYGQQALDGGMIGMAFTNTSPLVNPTGSARQAVGTNPICFAAPATDAKDDFVLDMATSSVALGKVEMRNRRGEKIPEGWGVDATGCVTTDGRKVVAEGGGLLPLGGDRENGGYKGYGLAVMVDVLCGVLSGATYGDRVRRWMTTDCVADLGQCFMAIDPAAAGGQPADVFKSRMSDMVHGLRDLPPVHGKEQPVMVAGDPEREHMSCCDCQGGIKFHVNQIKFANELAEKLNVKPMKLI